MISMSPRSKDGLKFVFLLFYGDIMYYVKYDSICGQRDVRAELLKTKN